jgi:hypothetical protein
MIIRKDLVPHVLNINPEYNEFVRKVGTMVVQVVAGLYGLNEAARLWYQHIAETLAEKEYKSVFVDRGLFYKREGLKICLLLLHVDDGLIGGNKDMVEDITSHLKKRNEIKESELNPEKMNYVGVEIQHKKKDKSFSLSQPGCIEKILKHAEGEEDLPFDENLFKETD